MGNIVCMLAVLIHTNHLLIASTSLISFLSKPKTANQVMNFAYLVTEEDIHCECVSNIYVQWVAGAYFAHCVQVKMNRKQNANLCSMTNLANLFVDYCVTDHYCHMHSIFFNHVFYFTFVHSFKYYIFKRIKFIENC